MLWHSHPSLIPLVALKTQRELFISCAVTSNVDQTRLQNFFLEAALMPRTNLFGIGQLYIYSLLQSPIDCNRRFVLWCHFLPVFKLLKLPVL